MALPDCAATSERKSASLPALRLELAATLGGGGRVEEREEILRDTGTFRVQVVDTTAPRIDITGWTSSFAVDATLGQSLTHEWADT